MNFKNAWNKFVSFFFPSEFKCMFCSRDIPKGDILCFSCLQSAPINSGKRCKLCDQPISGESEVCDFCKAFHKHFDRAFAPFKYEGDARKVVLKFKNGNAKYLTHKMAKCMFERFKAENITCDVIIPVPLSEKSMSKRGYNQSLLLAKELGEMLDLSVDAENLIKFKETKHQKELSFEDRQKNLENAFKVLHGKHLTGKTVLLVDDVITTGATANECAKILKKYTKHVYVLSFARNTYKN